MSKAEDRALEAYPVKEEWVGNQYGGPEDVNKISREKYTEGYHQAKKDLELTWEDIKIIIYAFLDLKIESVKTEKHTDEEYCREILKRFKERKEK